MNIDSVGSNSINNNTEIKKAKQSNPSFKGLLDVPGIVMNGIEKGGFAASFLVQDTLGMSVPRTGEGSLRDLDQDRVDATWRVIKAKLTFRKPDEEDKKKCLKFKELNFKEAAEVGIREVLSGPLMMFTPIFILAATRKHIGKSTYTNSSMLKRLGNKFTETVQAGAHEDKAALKRDFYRKNITDIVQSTTKAKDAGAEAEFIENAVNSLEELDNYSERIAQATGKAKKALKKEQKEANQRLLNAFNDFHKTHSSEYSMVNKVNFDGEVYSTDKTIDGIRGYAEDALKGKEAADITVESSEKFKKNTIAKRIAANAAAVLGTIASLSTVPMLYKLVNPVPPGSLGNPANADEKSRQITNPQPNNTVTKPAETQNKNNDGKVSFTGKWDKLAKNFEFNGGQFTPALMTGLAAGGLIGPRIYTAAKRAPEDPVTHKKDYSEIPEALTRDLVSTAAVTFGVPMLSNAIIGLYEKSTGFVLKKQPKEEMNAVQRTLDLLNPFSSHSYYEIKDLDQIYGNIDSQKKLTNMATFIDENGGSIAKVFDTDKNSKGVFNEYGLDIKQLAKQKDRRAANATILEKMKDSEFAQKVIDAIKPEKAGKDCNILKRARSLNSIVSCASTIIFVPLFLGVVLPKMVYRMTANRQKKKANEQQTANNTLRAVQKQASAKSVHEFVQNPNFDYSRMNNSAANNSAFKQLKHNS